ncbi:hypothetical protein [Saccharopolyspora thermophila]|uniref:Translation initiation factor IF-2 n=1 Tax=Saccharopolyspora thermophila TaxID=89367 RepID=A0ABP3MQA4_9PSEU
MTAVSDSARAFRNYMEALTTTHVASVRVVEQTWADTAKAADRSAQELTEKGQKLVQRIRERAENLRRADEKRGVQEIAVGEEPETEDPDPEVERFSQHLYAQQRSKADEPAATAAQSAAPPQSAPPGRHASPDPQPSSGWTVQAGRFGRRNQQPTPPPAAPPKPPAPKPAPRRQPVIDDDDDFENQSWLR